MPLLHATMFVVCALCMLTCICAACVSPDVVNAFLLFQAMSTKSNASQGQRKKKILSKLVHSLLAEECSDQARLSSFYRDNMEHSVSRNLLLDNRDFQIKLDTARVVQIIQLNIRANAICEDVLVTPNKTFIVIRFTGMQIAHEVYDLLHDNPPGLPFGTELNFVFICDRTYQSLLDKCNPLLQCYIDKFNPHLLPPGLVYLPEFISRKDNQSLYFHAYKIFASDNPKVCKLKNRKAMHYGSVFDYKSNTIDDLDDNVIDAHLPALVVPLLERLVHQGYIPCMPDQCTVNYYDCLEGDHIPMHVDTHSMCTNWIATFSTGSATVMAFNKAHGEADECKLVLEEGSVMIMMDEARYAWQHAIAKTLYDLVPLNLNLKTSRLGLWPRGSRISYTFRKTTPSGFQCRCHFPILCDSQKPKSDVVDISSGEANSLESKHVHQVYSQIATHFSSTRYGTWPRVVQFLDSFPPGSLILDAGCGNGKYMHLRHKHIQVIGSDRCGELLDICAHRGFDVFQDDVLSIGNTLRENIVDGCICIAVIHHLATHERRLEAIHNIVKLMAKNGRALIYVWAYEQRKDGKDSKYIKQNKTGDDEKQVKLDSGESDESKLSLQVHTNRSQFKQQDVFVPWKTKGQEDGVKHRYYHVFKQGELDNLACVEGTRIVQSYYDQGNWCVVLQKL